MNRFRKRSRGPLLAAMTAILFVTPAGLAKKPPGTPGGGDNADTNFAFAFEVRGKGIFLTTIDDGNRVQLTASKGQLDHASPSWSPDLDSDTSGYQGVIAYLAFDEQLEVTELRVVSPDGSGDSLVRAFPWAAGLDEPVPFEFDHDFTLAWTPNGREILFVDRAARVAAFELATGDSRFVLDFSDLVPADTGDVAISPLGMLAFHQNGDVFAAEYTLDEDGLIAVDPESVVAVIDEPDLNEEKPSFSPDGTYLAYTRLDPVTDWNIVVLDLLTLEEIMVLDGLGGRREVTWSPDGTQLAISNLTTSPRGKSLDIFRVTGWDDPAERRVIAVTQTDGQNNTEAAPDWNPGWLDN